MAHHPSANILGNIDKYQSVAPKSVVNALQKASQRTGVDFAYLLEQASTESNFNPKAKARYSSATGLFQFIDSTWLSMVKKHGDKYGLGELADKITINKQGKAGATDWKTRQKILELRNDPQISSYMAAEFALQNKQQLEKTLGRKANATDMYMAHLLGAGGATKFLKTLAASPAKDGDDILPRAAKSNKNLFYDRTNNSKARSVKEIYARFEQKFGTEIPKATFPAPEEKIQVAQVDFTPPPMPVTPENKYADDLPMPNRRYVGRVTADPVMAGQRLSAQSIWAMANMTSILLDITTSGTEAPQKDDNKRLEDEQTFSGFPPNGFFV